MTDEKILEIVKSNDGEIFELVVDKYTGDKKELFRSAVMSASDQVIAYLLDHHYKIDIDAYIDDSDTPLTYLLRLGYFSERTLKSIDVLLQNKANANLSSKDGKSLLNIIGDRYFWDALPLLVEHGADIFAEDDFGYDIFYKCGTSSADDNHLKLLIKKGFDINKKYYSAGARTLLQCIAAGHHWDNKNRWRFLLKNGADVNERDENGYTALMLSICHDWYFSDELDMARELLRHGADRYVRAFDGKTFDSIAEERNIDISSLAGLGRRF